MPATALERYVAPARLRPQIWRLILGLGLIFALYAGILAGGAALVFAVLPDERSLALAQDMALGRTPWGMVTLLFTFAALGLGPLVVAPLLHARAPRTLFGRPARVLRHFGLGVAVVGVVFGAANLAALAFPGPASLPGMDPGVWLRFLPLALIGVLIQTGAEELVFRAYLMQQLAARFRSRLVWLVLPALAFGVLHYEPDLMGPNGLPVVAATAAFGLVAGDLTARTGSIGLAWGLHFANNVTALLILSSGGVLNGLALRLSPVDMASEAGLVLLLGDVVLIGAVWGLCRLILRR